MDYAGGTLSTKNDVVDAFSGRDVEFGWDPNLEEAYTKYKEVFDANVRSFAENKDLSGDQKEETYPVTPPSWLDNEAQQAVDEITQQIRDEIHLDPNINYQTYPNPADAMLAAAADLTQKIEARQQDYVDRDRYMSGGKYSSASAKAISQVRRWYVDQVLFQINAQYGGAAEMINDKIDEEFGDSAVDVRKANKDGADLLKEAISFPIGLTMMAQHVQDDGTRYGVDELEYWDEEVTLGVDMVPDYLQFDIFYDPEQKKWIEAVKMGSIYIANPAENPSGETFIPLAVQNVNVFADIAFNTIPLKNGGQQVLPPSPSTAWVATTNIWKIKVKGIFYEFQTLDLDNEVHPNPIFGHEAQIFSRKYYPDIRDYSGSIVGNNLPVNFEFTTGTFIFVPPGPKGVGDRLEGGTIENSIGAINEGWII